MRYNWENNPELKDKLSLAGWRYAQLIEIVDLKANLQECIDAGDDMKADIEIVSFIEQDKSEYGHFVKTEEHEGKPCPVWDEKDAITFVSEVAAVDKKLAKAWLNHDWP
jgi:hypothetical protein